MAKQLSPAQLMQQRRDDYRFVFGTEEGERVLADILDSCRVNKAVFNGDALRFALNEGRRQAGLRILSILDRAITEVPADEVDQEEQ